MKTLGLLMLLLLACACACANPIVSPIPGYIMIFTVIAASLFEAGAVAVVLAIAGLQPMTVYGVFLLVNLVLYAVIFLPLSVKTNPWVAEAVIVAIDAAAIKGLSSLEFMQRDEFSVLKFRYALVAAVIGNAVSWGVGMAIQNSLKPLDLLGLG
ncbi:MAG: hypothetical protein ACYDCO_17615 [Armatimonadota bacterium]